MQLTLDSKFYDLKETVGKIKDSHTTPEMVSKMNNNIDEHARFIDKNFQNLYAVITDMKEEANFTLCTTSRFSICLTTRNYLSKVFCINSGYLKKFALRARNKIMRQHH